MHHHRLLPRNRVGPRLAAAEKKDLAMHRWGHEKPAGEEVSKRWSRRKEEEGQGFSCTQVEPKH